MRGHHRFDSRRTILSWRHHEDVPDSASRDAADLGQIDDSLLEDFDN